MRVHYRRPVCWTVTQIYLAKQGEKRVDMNAHVARPHHKVCMIGVKSAPVLSSVTVLALTRRLRIKLEEMKSPRESEQ